MHVRVFFLNLIIIEIENVRARNEEEEKKIARIQRSFSFDGTYDFVRGRSYLSNDVLHSALFFSIYVVGTTSRLGIRKTTCVRSTRARARTRVFRRIN